MGVINDWCDLASGMDTEQTVCTSVKVGMARREKSASHLSVKQPPVLREVQDGLHHPVWVQQAEDVPNAWLLPKRLAQAPACLVMLHSCWTPQQNPRARQGSRLVVGLSRDRTDENHPNMYSKYIAHAQGHSG